MITGAYTRFESLRPDISEFIYYFYLAMDFQKRLKPLYTGLRKVISKGTFLSMKTPIPQETELSEIVEHIKQQSTIIDAATEKAQREIDLIREYRTRLIADVVTGKVDARGLASEIGEGEEETLEPIEEDEGVDDEEMQGDDEPELIEETADGGN
jgi:type I restriction enzyme S subunit